MMMILVSPKKLDRKASFYLAPSFQDSNQIFFVQSIHYVYYLVKYLDYFLYLFYEHFFYFL